MSEIKLLPCPFCGGEVKLMAIAGKPYPPTYEVEMDKITKDSDDICFIHCPTCNANWHKEVRIESFPLDTIVAWNTRKPMDRIVERLEKEAMTCRLNWNDFDDECSFGEMNAFSRAIGMVKEAMNENITGD